MDDSAPTREKRSRLSPELRRSQILDAAGQLVQAQGHLPAPLDRLARAAGVSKALIYAYFPTQYDLCNGLLDREFGALLAAGLEEAARLSPLEAAALACADIYFQHVATTGSLTHILLRDPYLTGHLDRRLARIRDRITLALARAARRELRLSAKENVAAISIITTIPEEAGRLVHAGEMDHDRGRALNATLIRSSLVALTPRP